MTEPAVSVLRDHVRYDDAEEEKESKQALQT
jgi:hypothetical protein